MADQKEHTTVKDDNVGKSAVKSMEGNKSKVTTVRHKFEKSARELARRSSDPSETRSKVQKTNAEDSIQEFGLRVQGEQDAGPGPQDKEADRQPGTAAVRPRPRPQAVRRLHILMWEEKYDANCTSGTS